MPDPELAPLRLIAGDEELLMARAVAQTVAAARATDPDCDVREIAVTDVEPGDVYDLLSPSLFAQRRVVVLQRAHDARKDLADAILAYAKSPDDSINLVVTHAGGAKGKALMTALQKAGADVVLCKKLTRAEERLDFIKKEVAHSGGTISASAAAALLDAVGTELRELSAACSQLAADSGGKIDPAAVARYHTGRAEVTGFAVADRAVLGDVPGALETLRWAESVGVAHVLIADALADGIRTIARVAGAGRGNPYQLASELALPPWKVKRAQSQARGWTEPCLVEALQIVAGLNADVKGNAADPSYAIEQAIRRLGSARRQGKPVLAGR